MVSSTNENNVRASFVVDSVGLFSQPIEDDAPHDDLFIIDDHIDGEDSDDSDEACGTQEIHIDERSQTYTVHSSSCRKCKKGTKRDKTSEIPKLVRPKRQSKFRPLWPFGPPDSELGLLDQLSEGPEQSFVYHGICANPPEITKRGVARGNYAQLHRKAWLEVSDRYHRYGKNLRYYYRHWENLGYPTNKFFDWLDSKGEAAGQPLPNLEECPRSVLDADTVLYISNLEVTHRYAIDFLCDESGRGMLVDVDGEPVRTGIDGWIFVLRDHVLYAAPKVTCVSGHTKQRFHHSTFFSGKAVASAGIIITDNDGYLTRLYPHSGHYRPGEAHMHRMLYFLHSKGVDLNTFDMDTQQFRYVARDKDKKSKNKENKIKNKENEKENKKDKKKNGENESDKSEKKLKKVDSLHLEKAIDVAYFLAHKTSFVGRKILEKIRMIRNDDAPRTVTEALSLIEEGDAQKRDNDDDQVKNTGDHLPMNGANSDAPPADA